MKISFVTIIILVIGIACSKTGNISNTDPLTAYGDIRNGFSKLYTLDANSDSAEILSHNSSQKIIIRCPTQEICNSKAQEIANSGHDVEIAGTIQEWELKNLKP